MWRVSGETVQWLHNVGKGGKPGLIVRCFVPSEFPVFLVVPHPGQREADDGSVVEVSWSEVTQQDLRAARQIVKFEDLIEPGSWQDLEVAGPVEGTLPDLPGALCERLVDALRTFRDENDRYIFAFFSAWSTMIPEFEAYTTVQIAGGEYFIAGGPLGEVCEQGLTPSMWWPENRAWIVVSPIDAQFSLIGCTQAMARSLLDRHRIEGWPVSLDDPIPL